ncbi:glycine--tRNA ligase subunit beta [Legionella israelensis]|uniref:Glycine--tRNA ligase beta subunit n=1 Tax=Legionella israelensis TaxID=454 RepID=A0A0W0WBW1_9GAMM|nr:glycine--tRNA ligase subunit beta [Legionella israelensis]KTD29726.1 glycyl-tRNA synthetase beta chain [Legionella israelensis]QBS08854.1 glycine--tRNA ligase subunit beta [Legionella israelensis]SCY02188.1 glycyl-tRNA synthetase beta chain [Legionella israelensis DSM 19235]STX58537.1 glycyl-tRNA synthetase beta chain [Legionella israelensis]
MSKDLLFELGCEELPSASVLPLAEELANHLSSSLDKAQLNYTEIKYFAAPRRLAVRIKNLQTQQPQKTITRKGPALKAAYDEQDCPTAALSGFARSCGVAIEKLSTVKTDKGDWIVYESVQEGEKTEQLIPALIDQALASLPITRPMRWGEAEIEFVRPVHWAVLLYGDTVISAEILGVTTDRKSRGHRFHHASEITVSSPSTYEMQLREAYVIADFASRREEIVKQVNELAETKKAVPVMSRELLDEVTSIVEWPKALLAGFDDAFLDVPPEALIASMQSHQKCFALKNQEGQLLPCFITVANIESKDVKEVVVGNEKVMHARLSDAAFFFHQDKKKPLNSYMDMTAQVVFQNRLGSLQDKTNRIQALMSQWIHSLALSPEQVESAARLSKCDLMTGMVGEFPELQGLMGYYYALNDKEDRAVAVALKEQYLPRFSGDELPETPLGLALSLADRLDTMAGIFAIGQKPSGVKDPFKLRRHAFAIVRLLQSTPAKLKLSSLIHDAAQGYIGRLDIPDELVTDIKNFILDRLQSHYQLQGVTSDLIHAVLACQNEWLYDTDQRLQALKSFVALPEAASLSAACKRVNNILQDVPVSEDTVSKTGIFEDIHFTEEAEMELYRQIIFIEKEIEPWYVAGNYMKILERLAGLRKSVDDFFDKVMVMVDDEVIRTNRLKLLSRLQRLLMGVADISLLQLPAGS